MMKKKKFFFGPLYSHAVSLDSEQQLTAHDAAVLSGYRFSLKHI